MFWIEFALIALLHSVLFDAFEWGFVCYNEHLEIFCGRDEWIVIHDASFGYFRENPFRMGWNQSCVHGQGHISAKECHIDVTTTLSAHCSGQQSCRKIVHYSVDLSHEYLTSKCIGITDETIKPSLFAEYSCVSTSFFTKFSGHVDPEHIGGYLTTEDYTETRRGGPHWRSHLADAVCHPGREQMPYKFHLLPPKIERKSATLDDPNSRVSFILRVKDISLTQPPIISDGFGSGPWRIGFHEECESVGAPCAQDFLQISAELQQTHGSMHTRVPVTRFCLVSADTPSRHLTSQGLLNSDWIKNQIGPLINASGGLYFESNLNLLGENVIPGKGILIEYIALYCPPINAPSGNGIVDYRFNFRPYQTIAYADMFCPHDRWFVPVKTSSTMGDDTESNETTSHWWREQKRYVQRICDHHHGTWTPPEIPHACLTDTELKEFVKLMENPTTMTHLVSTSPLRMVSDAQFNKSQPHEGGIPMGHTSNAEENQKKLHAGVSVAVGALSGFILCLLAVVLIVYSLRHRLVAQYHKANTYPDLGDHRTISASTFNQSMQSFYPTSYRGDWRTKWNKSKWNLFKPWRVPPWAGYPANGLHPHLPRQTSVVNSNSHLKNDTSPFGLSNKIPGPTNGLSYPSLGTIGGGFENHMILSNISSPCLRTNSVTQFESNMKPFGSSNEMLTPMSNGQQHTLPPSWLPWSRTSRKNRRLRAQHLRRLDAQFQSQRRLLDSGSVSTSPSFTLGLEQQSRQTTRMIESESRQSFNSPRYSFDDRPPSQMSTRTLLSNEVYQDESQVCNGCMSQFYNPINGYLNYPYTTIDERTGAPLVSSPPQCTFPSTTDQLPWKSSPPGNTFSQGLKRLSSVLRPRQSPLTPPRTARRLLQQTPQQIHPKSTSTLNTIASLNQANRDGSFSFIPLEKGVRSRSESGSVRGTAGGLLRSLFNISSHLKLLQDPSIYELAEQDDGSNSSGTLNQPTLSSSLQTHTTCPSDTVTISPRSEHPEYAAPSAPSYHSQPLSAASSIRPYYPGLISPSMRSGMRVCTPTDPYLIPNTVKRLQANEQNSSPYSETDPLPSGTSSAVSSLIFADLAEDERGPREMMELPPIPIEPTVDQTPNKKYVWSSEGMDYVTYDEARSEAENPLFSMEPDENEELSFADDVQTPTNVRQTAVQERASNVKLRGDIANDPTSRPLSDAMISNHYYDGTETLGDGPNASAVKSPTAITRLSPIPQLPLPPLWTTTQSTSPPTSSAGRRLPMASSSAFKRSIESLYETVEHFGGDKSPPAFPARPSPCASVTDNAMDQHQVSLSVGHQVRVLPSTPDSLGVTHPPVACMDEDLE